MSTSETRTRAHRSSRIVVDPAIMAGKPTVRGTRIPVDLVLKRLSQDLDMRSLLESYPRLTEEDVRACLAYAQEQIARAYEAAHPSAQ